MPPKTSNPRMGFVFLHFLPWLILCLGLAITYVAQGIVQQNAKEILQEEFNSRANEIIANIESRLSGYKSVLRGAAGLFVASQSVDRNGFRKYVSALNLERHYPGIQGVGYSLLVAPSDKDRHIKEISREGFARYAIRPEGVRETYTAIIYLEPFDWRNQRALGYDMYAEPTRRAAMERARDENRTAVSGKVKLAQETEKDMQAGFLMYVPVYRNDAPHDTLAQRRANLKGWMHAPFRMNDLMRGILGKHFGEVSGALDLEIYDGDTPSAESLMYDTNGTIEFPAASPRSAFQSARTIDVGGRDWTITVSSLPGFESRLKSYRAQVIMIAGIAVSLLLAWVVWLLINGRSRALTLATGMTRELSASESRLKALFEHMSSGVTVYAASADGKDFFLTAFNRAAEKIDKIQSRALLGKSVREIFPDSAESGLLDVLRRVWQSGVAEQFSASFYKESCIAGWRENQVYKLPDGAVVAIYDDVTERRRAEEALLKSFQEIGDLYHNAPCGYHSLDKNGIFLQINDTELSWLGYTREEIVGRTRFADVLSPASSQTFHENYPTFMQRGWVKDREYEIVRKDGTVLPVLLSSTAIRDGDGNYLMSRTTIFDITERKRAEIGLENSNRFYSVLSRVNEAIVRTAERNALLENICRIAVEDGKFTMAWIGMVDEKKEAIFPVACWGHEAGYLDYLQSVGVLELNGPTCQAIKNGEFRISQDIAVDPHMAPWRQEALDRGYHSSAALPLSLGGKVAGAISLYAIRPDSFDADVLNMLNDLSEDISFALGALDQQERRQAAEERLRQLNEELEQRVAKRTWQLEAANKELEAFSYSVSHDLRAPLRSIDGFSEILEKRYAERLDDAGRDYLGRVRRASKRMGELIDDLLLLARVTRAELHKEPVDLSRMVQIMAREIQEAAPQRQVEWVIQDGIVAQAGNSLIKVVLENLLGNAWKFTAHQTAPRIEFGMIEREDEKVIFMRDNGAGFDMQYAGKLFGAFQRLHKADEFEGTGIGLATVQRIIHRHGGRVWAEGQTGAGATFYFAI